MPKTRRAELRDAPAIEKLACEQIVHQNTKLPETKGATSSAPAVNVDYHLSQRFGKLTNIEKLM
jgi:hypothetical protein